MDGRIDRQKTLDRGPRFQYAPSASGGTLQGSSAHLNSTHRTSGPSRRQRSPRPNDNKKIVVTPVSMPIRVPTG